MNSVASIDWFTFSVKGAEDPDQVIWDYLRIEKDLFQENPWGKFGYSKSKSFGGIVVFYAPAEDRIADMGICVSMSGDGCRTFEQHTQFFPDHATPFITLMENLHTNQLVNITRVDLACDDRDKMLDLNLIASCVCANNVNSRIRSRRIVEAYAGEFVDGLTVYFGAESSDFRIRFYDKAKQMYKRDQPEFHQHWVRCELVMRGKNATGFCDCIVNSDGDLGELAACILNDKLAFINREDDENISRCSICDWWSAFVDSFRAVKLVSRAEKKHSMLQKLDWVKLQIAPTLSLIQDAFGFMEIHEILKLGRNKRSAHQDAILESYKYAYCIVGEDDYAQLS